MILGVAAARTTLGGLGRLVGLGVEETAAAILLLDART